MLWLSVTIKQVVCRVVTGLQGWVQLLCMDARRMNSMVDGMSLEFELDFRSCKSSLRLRQMSTKLQIIVAISVSPSK